MRIAILAFSYPFAIIIKLLVLLTQTLKERYKAGKNAANVIFVEVIRQTYFTGVQSLGLIILFAILTGVIAGVEISLILEKIGNPSMVNELFYDVVIRELATLITAVVIIGRSATAVAVELATLTVNQEIDALRSLRINPLAFLVYPRVFAITICSIFLSSIFTLVCLLVGALFVYIQSDVPFTIYLYRIALAGEFKGVLLLAIKGFLNGLFIALISCYLGLSVKPALTEIPKAASKTVIFCTVAVLIVTALVALVAYI